MLKFWIWNWAWNEETRRVLLRDCEILRNIWQPSFQAQFHIQNFNIDISGFYYDRFPRPHWEVIARYGRPGCGDTWARNVDTDTWRTHTLVTYNWSHVCSQTSPWWSPFGPRTSSPRREESSPASRNMRNEMEAKRKVCCVCSLQFIIFAPAPMSINMD